MTKFVYVQTADIGEDEKDGDLKPDLKDFSSAAFVKVDDEKGEDDHEGNEDADENARRQGRIRCVTRIFACLVWYRERDVAKFSLKLRIAFGTRAKTVNEPDGKGHAYHHRGENAGDGFCEHVILGLPRRHGGMVRGRREAWAKTRSVRGR